MFKLIGLEIMRLCCFIINSFYTIYCVAGLYFFSENIWILNYFHVTFWREKYDEKCDIMKWEKILPFWEGKSLVNFLFIGGGFIMLNGPEIINDWNLSTFLCLVSFPHLNLGIKDLRTWIFRFKKIKNLWTQGRGCKNPWWALHSAKNSLEIHCKFSRKSQ